MSAITKSAPVAANEAKRRCVENTTPRGQSDSLCALDQESVLHVLGFLHFSDLNEFGSCSKACRVLRNSDRLNPTREGEIRFCRNRVLHVSDMIQSFAQLQLRGKFGKERTHLKICMKHVESTEVMSMREIRSALKSRDRLLDPFVARRESCYCSPSPAPGHVDSKIIVTLKKIRRGLLYAQVEIAAVIYVRYIVKNKTGDRT